MTHPTDQQLKPSPVRPLTQERLVAISTRIEDLRNVLMQDALRNMLAGSKGVPGELSVRLVPSFSRFVAR
jgi:hypothetical protein